MPTFAETILPQIEAAIEQLTTANVSEYTLPDGRRVRKQDLPELVKLRDKFRRELQSEQAAAAVASGLPNPRKVVVRFR